MNVVPEAICLKRVAPELEDLVHVPLRRIVMQCIFAKVIVHTFVPLLTLVIRVVAYERER